MNHSHLQETAKHYARLAEEAQAQLQEEQELNEGLIQILDVLCEELGVDTEELLNDFYTNISEGSRGIGRLLRKAQGIAKKQKRVTDTFSPSHSLGHDIQDVLAQRASETLGQIEVKRANRFQRARERVARSAIGDTEDRKLDAGVKQKTGMTVGQHASAGTQKLEKAEKILSGKYTKDGTYTDDPSQSATGGRANLRPTAQQQDDIEKRSNNNQSFNNQLAANARRKERAKKNKETFGREQF